MKFSFAKSLALVMVIMLACGGFTVRRWGFFGHQRINRLAVFTLPPDLFPFYKKNIVFITENSVNPDSRRNAVKEEAPRHYIDLDVYGDSAEYTLPRYWNDAVKQFTEDTLQTYGIVPWHVQLMKIRLTKAFAEKDLKRILILSAEIGHYIGDANVPLHTTENYNGQLTDQHGIHGFWESRLPEAFSNDYDFMVGQAEYIKNTQLEAWEAVINAHQCLDSVFGFEKELTQKMGEDKKWAFVTRNNQTIKTYSLPFSEAYHNMLAGQVERRMRAAIKMVGDFWYTCWVDAGQPNLDNLDKQQLTEQELAEIAAEKKALQESNAKLKVREHANEGVE